MNSYVDLTTLKSSSVADFASVTTHDTFLLVLLEAASRAIDEYCNRHFFTYEGTKYYDGAGQILFLDDLLSITTFKTDEDQDGTFEETWTENEDYQLYPINDLPKLRAEITSRITREYADFNNNVKKGVEIAGVFGYGDGKTATPYKDSGAVVNTGGITSGATTHALATGKGASFAVGQTIRIGTEQLYISGISTDTLTFERAVNGTTAAAHTAADVIYIYQYPKAIQIATIMQTLRWWKRRESAFQTSVQTELGTTNVYRGLDPDIRIICNMFKKELAS